MITAQAKISLPALSDNFQFLKSKAPESRIICVVKGNAYGHGAIKVAKHLSGADGFAVSRIEEAIELRNAGIEKPILLLEGVFCKEELLVAAENHFATTVHNEYQKEMLIQTKLSQPIKVWLKIDTGMHRIGIMPDEVGAYVKALAESGKLEGEPCFISHFARADESRTATQKQLDIFIKATAPYPGEKTLANSAGILFYPEAHFDQIRAGIALYGISPIEGKTGKDLGLKPVMQLQSKIISVRKQKKGEPVGYGAIWHASEDTNIAVVAMGYGDGFPRVVPEGMPVLINGRICPIVGRISMDMLTVDLGADSQDNIGDTVVFWGEDLPVENIAEKLGTIGYELVIQLLCRVRRTYA